MIVSQSYNWITPNKNYLKLFVSDDGMYRITQPDFTQAGINTSSIDPRTIKLYYLGNEIPVYFQGDQDGVFDPTDYLDFYGTRNYGGLTNTYLATYAPNTVHYVTDEYFNPYSDTNVYWLGWDGAFGLRYTSSNISVPDPYSNDYFLEKIHLEKDSLYSPGETINFNTDFRYFNNEKISGEGWFWRNFTPSFGMVWNANFSAASLYNGPVNCGLRIFAYPNSKDTSFNEHKVVIRINSTTVSTLARNDYERFDTTIQFSSSLLQANNSVNVTYTPTFGNPAATPSLYFDLVELNYPRQFKFDNNTCRFTLPGSDTSFALFRLTGFNPSNPLSIYDVKHHMKVISIEANGDTLLFSGRKDGQFEIANSIITKKPFRISVRQVQNLASPANGADYIVIYNRLFESQANQLANHRSSLDNFRTYKAPVDDIIDIFNFGIESPVAIRNFMKFTYDNWQAPKVKYLCLFGRGSLDPKNIRSVPDYYKNLVPIYGSPAADGYFVTFNPGGFVYYKQVAVGRITAYTQQEAQDIVNKIIDYDNIPVDNWWKKFIMITGGPNRTEQLIYQAQSNDIINSFIQPPPISGISSRIYRNDSAGYITFNYADSIRKEINRGGLIVNFIGHAASQDWELGLEDPGTLSNYSKLPLVLSMTCFTGKNAETNSRGFGEKFLYTQNRGAVAFLGSTGWSFSSTGNNLNNFIFRGFSQDSIRRIGDLIKFADLQMLPDSISFQTRNMINCYDLQGDPATKLRLPTSPEFVIEGGDYRISNPYPVVGEPITLTIFPRNLGTFAPTCLIRFEILRNGQQYRVKDSVIHNFRFTDTLSYNFTLDTLGNYSLMVILDFDNAYPLEDPNNNVIIIPLPLRNISFSPLKPIHNSVIRSDSVIFLGLNPQVDPRRNSVKIILQVDTNKNFINPVYNYTNQNVSGVATKVPFRIPWLDSNSVYYWRTNSIINNDSTGWSKTNAFVFNPQVTQFKSSRTIPQDSVITIYQKLQGQFAPQDVSNLQYTPSGYTLLNFQGTLHVKSYGSNGSEASFFNINNFTIYADGGNNQGLNIVKVRRFTGSLVEFKNFAFSSPQSSDSVLNFLNTFDTSHYVMIGYAAIHPLANDSIHANCRTKIRQFGSVYIDSLPGMHGFDSWAFIGYLGGVPPNVSEEFHRWPTQGCINLQCPSNANLAPTFLSTFGTINFSFGPAHRWKYFSWNQQLAPNSQILFDVTGINRSEDSTAIYQNVTTNSFVNLDTVNSYNTPNLRLLSKITIDSVNGLGSPYFKNLYFKYTPPCEIIPDNYSFVKSDSAVQEGQDVTISAKVFNIGFVPAGIAVYRWTAVSRTGLHILKSDTVYTPLLVDSIKISSVTFNTQGLKYPQSTSDTVSIGMEVSLLNSQNDYYEYNNFAFTKLVVFGDSTGPSIEATFDGEKLVNGDYIRSKPEVVFKFFDESPINYNLEDTSSIFIKVDNRKILFNSNPQILFELLNDGNLKTKITYKPELSEGEHIFQFIGGDREGNKDTLINNGNVSNQFQVRNVYNYPNPFSSFTNFTFVLLASDNVQNCRIKIYSVAGRLVKEITAFARVGFNMVYWDGRDSDGDSMANGVYLYKIILDDGSKSTSQIQKMAILK
jgi:hypothetical protein